MAWDPQPGPQTSAILADWVDELFFGGERGGGKSDLQLGYQEDGALRDGPAHRGIVFRKTYNDLEELQVRAAEIFPQTGAIYKTQPSPRYPFSNCWYWPNGATTKMRYIEHERDYTHYHGHQYTRISFDEVTEYPTPAGVLLMISTLRSPHGVHCSMRLTGNPGGPGHGWVKRRYISIAPPFTPWVDPESGLTRMFIPSRLRDNRRLQEKDPNYMRRIIAATYGNETLRRAWTRGDWNVVAGAFFDCWDESRHVVQPFEIPADWARFRSMDWGSARPFSVGWWAVASDATEARNIHGDAILIPRGCLVRYREWYGVKVVNGQVHDNIGLKMTAEAVGEGIAERSKADPEHAYGVLDPSAFKEDGGPSIAENLYLGSGRKYPWRPADNTRVAQKGAIGGWDLVRARFEGDEDGHPMIVCFTTCEASRNTIPMLQHDPDRLEDLNTNSEDHCADDWRYACASRPFIRASQKIVQVRPPGTMTFDQLLKLTGDEKPKSRYRR